MMMMPIMMMIATKVTTVVVKYKLIKPIFLDYSFVKLIVIQTSITASSTTMTAATTVRSPPMLEVDFWGETPSKETISPMPLKCPNHQCAQADFFVHGIKGGQQHHRLIF